MSPSQLERRIYIRGTPIHYAINILASLTSLDRMAFLKS
jgi:hypothetical protein